MIVHYKYLLWYIIIYFRFNLSLAQMKGIKDLLSDKLTIKNDNNYGYIHEIKNFLFYKSNVIYERSCVCEMEMSCSCCESVVLLYTKSLGQLCGNILYRPEGLNVNITLDGNTIRSMTVTNYRPLKICALIPKSLFSIICLNILELNLFPRSITACPRLEIATKNQNWKINYTCVSISTPMGSEVDSLIVNNSNRLTNSGVINQLTVLGNQTVSTQSVSPPKQTQSQFSAMTPGAINLLNSNTSVIGIIPETLNASSTSSMVNFMHSSNRPVSLMTSTSTSNIPLSMSSGTSSTSSVIMSSRNLPYTDTTKLTCKKSSETTGTQTNFRNFPITATTSTTVNSKIFTPYFENTLSIIFRNFSSTTATLLATTEQSSISGNTPVSLNYSSLIINNTKDTSETNRPITNNTFINSDNTSIIHTTSMDTRKITETLNKTFTPVISIIPIIFPDNYSNLFFDDLNSNDTQHFSTTFESASSSTSEMKDESTETIMEIMLTTQTIVNNTNQYSDDQAIQSTILDSSIKSLENTTISHI